MKNDRNVYPGMQNMPFPGYGFPGAGFGPGAGAGFGPGTGIPGMDQYYQNLDNRVTALERQVRRLDNRVTRLEQQFVQPTPFGQQQPPFPVGQPQQPFAGQPMEQYPYQTSMQMM